MVPERYAMPMPYAICGICPQEGATHFSGHIYIYIYPRACESQISMVLVSVVGLALLAQLYNYSGEIPTSNTV